MDLVYLNPPNDWDIRKCLALCFGLLLAALVVIEVGALSFDLVVLRQLVGFLFLVFVPGLLILRILKIHNIKFIECILYSVGLSIAFAMSLGVILNFILRPLGITHPISVLSIIIGIVILPQ
jgi:uncharacterized membrane protein